MALKYFEKIVEELTETQAINWNLDDVIPVKLPKDQSGQAGQSGQSGGQEAKVIGEPMSKQPQSGPSDGQGSQGSPGEKQDSKETEKAGSENKESNGTPETPQSGTSDVSSNKEWMDNHSKIEKGDSSGKSIIKQAYKEVEAEYQKRAARGIGTGAGSLIEKIKKFTKEDFDLSKVLSRISSFKRKLSKYYKRKESHHAAVFNPATQQTNIISPGRIKQKQNEKKSAVLFFACDTSGSITSEDYKVIFGYLQDIAKKFEKKEYDMDGEVFLIEWDTMVHTPIKEFKAIKSIKPNKELSDKEREELKLRGGGGTDIQALFNWMDKNFVKNIDGQDYFVFSDKMSAFTEDEIEKDVQAQITQKLKPPDENYREQSWKDEDFRVPPGQFNLKEGGIAHVPFLIIYTDGWFNPPNVQSSKLFGNALGNIIYIVTDRSGIKNIRPKNYIYHNLRAE